MIKIDNEIFIKRAIEKHGDKYDYSLVDYKSMRKKIKIICNKGHVFIQSPHRHLIGVGCVKCFIESRKSTLSYFINKSNITHSNYYNYDKSEYVNGHTLVTISCPNHGDFLQTPDSHLKSAGCPKCGIIKRSNSRKNDFDELICRFRKQHGNKYDYSKVKYIKMRNKINIVCIKHNFEFKQTPEKHINSKNGGCPVCYGNCNIDNEIFIKKAKIIHGDKYDYSHTIYKKSNIKIQIFCKIHGIFKMPPYSHLEGRGCKTCNRNGGILENKWLDSLGISNDFRQFSIGKMFVDGIDLKNKTVYEFYGDYWHGNPEIYAYDDINKVSNLSFGELYNRTIKRENYLKQLGYKVVSIWESDYKNNIKL